MRLTRRYFGERVVERDDMSLNAAGQWRQLLSQP
jgi:hypothetical protein